MQLTVDLDRREDAVEWLVRARLEREGGPGTYAEAVTRIRAGGPGADRLQAALQAARVRADRHVTDVIQALEHAGGR